MGVLKILYTLPPLSGQRPSVTPGFTLIEISIVIAAMSLMMVGMVQGYRLYTTVQKIALTKQRIIKIQDALESFRVRNGRYPCVAPLTAAPDAPGYATEIPNCLAVPPGVFFDAVPAGSPGVHTGAVPGRTLNLADEDTEDGWGRRFTYAVATQWAFPIPPPPAPPPPGAISVIDLGSNPVFTSQPPSPRPAAYVIVSHGQDGLGAYTHAGKLFSPCDLVLAKDGENCNFGLTGFDVTFRDTTERSTHLGMKFYYDDYLLIGPSATSTDPFPATDRQVFDADGLWTAPVRFNANATTLIQCWGAGGGGGSGGPKGGGGGGGAYEETQVLLSALGATQAVTIGAGGSAGVAGNGGNGGNSLFGAVLSAQGGNGGVVGGGINSGGAGGAAGSPAGVSGGKGSDGGSRGGGGGGAKPGGDGGDGGAGGGKGGLGGSDHGPPEGSATNGSAPGGGGGGGGAGGSNGGAGAPGRCLATTSENH